MSPKFKGIIEGREDCYPVQDDDGLTIHDSPVADNDNFDFNADPEE